jgi:hypothetical protein
MRWQTARQPAQSAATLDRHPRPRKQHRPNTQTSCLTKNSTQLLQKVNAKGERERGTTRWKASPNERWNVCVRVFTNREPAAELLAEELDLHCALASCNTHTWPLYTQTLESRRRLVPRSCDQAILILKTDGVFLIATTLQKEGEGETGWRHFACSWGCVLSEQLAEFSSSFHPHANTPG